MPVRMEDLERTQPPAISRETGRSSLHDDSQTLTTAQLGCDPPTKAPALPAGPGPAAPPRAAPRGPHRRKALGLSPPTSPAGSTDL